VTATDLADLGSEPPVDARVAGWTAVRWGALAIYFAALVAWCAEYGIPLQRELVMAWVCGALAVASLGRSRRQVLQLLLDWVPLALVLGAYDFSRGVADSLGIQAHVHTMVDFDRFVFGGTTPTEWLQARLEDPLTIKWWNVAFTLVYTS
jgi:hypothetical protein